MLVGWFIAGFVVIVKIRLGVFLRFQNNELEIRGEGKGFLTTFQVKSLSDTFSYFLSDPRAQHVCNRCLETGEGKT